jgi:putative MATE family efflux protein
VSSEFRKVLSNKKSRIELLSTWRELISLGWPVSVQTAVRTGMRTTDLLVVAIFSSSAIAAVGLANLYTQVALFIGIGLGTGGLALSSQDTGSKAFANRDEAISQALLIGFLIGIPIAAAAILFSEYFMLVFGAPSEVVALGASYLAIVLGTAPFRHLVLIGEKSLQGTGDTITPMLIRGGSNVVNIVGTVGLGLGIGVLPRLEVIGVAIATGVANVLAGLAVIVVFLSARTEVQLTLPTDIRITKQLLKISTPRTVQGLSRTAATFPLNIIVVAFSVEAYAAYTVGQRVFQQVTGPIARSANVVASIITGQDLGKSGSEIESSTELRFRLFALALLSFIAISLLGALMFLGNDILASFFGDEEATRALTNNFIRAFAISAPAAGLARVYAGVLQGSGETTKPFIAELIGNFGMLLGITYVGGVLLGYGVFAVYVAVIAYGVCRFGLVFFWYQQDNWMQEAFDRMEDRGSIADN